MKINKKKVLFWVLIPVSIVLIFALMSLLENSCIIIEQKNVHFMSQLGDKPDTNNYYMDGDVIPDAQTAAKIGSAIIDNMCGNGWDFGFLTIDYDDQERLWKVHKSYLFGRGGYAIVDQETGEIIQALKYK